MRLIFGPIWGGLSDRIGRRPVLLVGILGYVVTMAWFGLANRLWMLFAARILSGILSSATAPTTMADVSDSTSKDERGGGMGLLGAAGGIGTILGPVMGGFLTDASLLRPFFTAAGMALLALVLALVFLPESRPVQEQNTKEKRAMRRGPLAVHAGNLGIRRLDQRRRVSAMSNAHKYGGEVGESKGSSVPRGEP